MPVQILRPRFQTAPNPRSHRVPRPGRSVRVQEGSPWIPRQAPSPLPRPAGGRAGGRAVGRADRQGVLSGRARPTWRPGPRASAARPPGNFFPPALALLLPPRVARPPARSLFLCGGDRISPRHPRTPGRPGRVRGQGPLPAPPAPRAPGRRPRRGWARRVESESEAAARARGEPSRPPCPPPERRREEGAPRPTLLPAWPRAGRAAAP